MHPSPTASAPIENGEKRTTAIAAGIERVIVWVGSPASLLLHTIAFFAFFAASLSHLVDWTTMLLVLTTVVSLEAIYLAIFIQFSVNRQAASLKEVEEDVESIQEDIGEISEDEAEEAAEEDRKKKQAEMLEALTNDVRTMLRHLGTLKGG